MANDRVNEMTDAAKTAAAKIEGAFHETAAKVAATVEEKMPEVRDAAQKAVASVEGRIPDTVKDKVRDATGTVSAKAAEVTPVQVRDATDRLTAEAKKRPMMAVAAGVAALLVFRRLLRRKR
ncbi:hypothetical protein [Herbidospora daliensis]|uniref:hypothetical protein n=1 Tax=Herbidospora daliensis TaxID=295585 RepID=UPI000780EF16|nr:hypothetical protein [Herbidospora daliensis]